MLDRDEAAALAQIEAFLRRDDPEFVSLLERIERDPLGLGDLQAMSSEHELVAALDAAYALPPADVDERPGRRWLRVLSTVIAATLALAVTLAVTAAWGPDAGGLAGVLSIMAATMFGYQTLRGCPGRR